jgi:hypothetical protein
MARYNIFLSNESNAFEMSKKIKRGEFLTLVSKIIDLRVLLNFLHMGTIDYREMTFISRIVSYSHKNERKMI